jgi:hypothetical protein
MSPYLRDSVVVVISLALGLGATPLYAQKAGKLFTSPLKNFTVVVPEFGSVGLGPDDTKVQKQNNKEGGTVSFMNGAGRLLRIDYTRLLTGTTLPTDSAELQVFHHKALEDQILRTNPSSLLSERAYVLDDAPMLLALVSFPAGSSLQDAVTGKHMDSVRAVLIFARGGFLYMLHAELVADIFHRPGKAPLTVEELSRRADNWIPNFYRSIKVQ